MTGGVAWAVSREFPALSFGLASIAATSAALALIGLLLNGYPKIAFRRVGTTVDPMRPDATTHLVTTGIYRFTRNPMYLGYGFILLGWSVFLSNFAGLLVVPVFVAYVTRFQIQPEERALSTLFPKEYARFRSRVPRWL